MKQQRTLACLATLALLCGGAKCGGGDDGQTSAGDDAGMASADAGNANCKGVPDFHIGTQALGGEGLVLGEIVDADPIHKYENDWVVKLSDPDGKPLTDLDLYKVQPFMPAHGHDGTFDPVISKTTAAGTYNVKRINLWMKDHWEVRFFMHVGNKDDEVIFNVCVPP